MAAQLFWFWVTLSCGHQRYQLVLCHPLHCWCRTCGADRQVVDATAVCAYVPGARLAGHVRSVP